MLVAWWRRFRPVAIGLLTLLLSVGFGTSAAKAAVGFGSTGPFVAPAPPLPQSVASDEATGDVLATENQGEAQVAIYSGTEAEPAKLGQFGIGELVDPRGIAVDGETGDVYVGDNSLGRVLRYLKTAGSPPTYALDSSYVGPTLGSGAGEVGSFAGQLAVDPTDGDLLLADPSSNRIDRFDPSGAFVSSFDASDSGRGAFHNILDFTVAGNGQIYVVDLIEENIFGASDSVIERFSSAGNYLSTLAVPEARSITYDPVADVEIAVGEDFYNAFTPPPHARFFVLEEGSVLNELAVPSPTSESKVGDLAADGGHERLFTATSLTESQYGAAGAQAFDSFLLPNATTGQVTGLTAYAAHVSGAINPLGEEAGYYFEWSGDGGQSWKRTAEVGAGSGEADVPVETELTGLDPNLTYEVRLIGVNANGSNTSKAVTFTTEVGPPGVVTGEVNSRTTTGAGLQGTINPFGIQTTFYFEYGLTTSYGSRVPASSPSVAGHGRAPLPVSVGIEGLIPHTEYHYRLVGASAGGTAFGQDRSFTTRSEGPQRAFEMVSPVEKQGTSVRSFPTKTFGFQARADGNSMVYTTVGATPESRSGTLMSRHLAQRSPDGWASSPIDLPTLDPEAFGLTISLTLAVSEDQSHAFVVSRRALTPGAVEKETNYYIEDLPSGTLEFVGTGLNAGAYSTESSWVYLGGTPDFSSVAFIAENPLTPDSLGVSNTYLWKRGVGLRSIQLLPDGSPANGGAEGNSYYTDGKHQMSTDGKRIFYTMNGDNPGNNGVYVFENGHGRDLSVPQIEGSTDDPPDANFISATPDGSKVMFEVPLSHVPLTPDAPAGAENVYVANVETGALEFIAPIVTRRVGVSDDLSYFYFSTEQRLTQEKPTAAEAGTDGYLYVSHDGIIKLVAPAAVASAPQGLPEEYVIDPSGRFLAFTSIYDLTGQDNPAGGRCGSRPCNEIYLYDAVSGSVKCVSCTPDDSPPLGDASLSHEAGASFLSRHETESVLTDGRVFFDTPDPLVRSDVNGTRDVYEFDGEPHLVSSGRANTLSALADVTPDGNSVFFVTDDKLVAQDQDNLYDLYDARVGGGIAAQNEVPSGAGCAEDCRGRASGPPPAAVGSEAISGRPSNRRRRDIRRDIRERRAA